jgi:hypothetical protein
MNNYIRILIWMNNYIRILIRMNNYIMEVRVRAVMAFSRGFLCSRNLLIILYIYLILNGSILKKQRGKCLSCTNSILYVSELLACSRPVYNGNIRRKTVNLRKPLGNSIYFLLGSRLFINTSIAIILLRLSGDIQSNPAWSCVWNPWLFKKGTQSKSS